MLCTLQNWHCWSTTDAHPGLPRVVSAAIKVAISFKIWKCSWLLWGPRSCVRLSLSSGIWILVYEHPCRRDSPFNHTPKPHFFLTLFVDDLGDEFVGQLCAWLRRVLIECAVFFWIFFPPLALLFGLLGLAPRGLISSTLAHRLCTMITHGRLTHSDLALYSSALAFRPFHC